MSAEEIDLQLDADSAENCVRTEDFELRFFDEHGHGYDVRGVEMENGPEVVLTGNEGRELRISVAPNIRGLEEYDDEEVVDDA